MPGPDFPLYLDGAELVATYPMGPIMEGAGLNVTVLSYMDNVDFGFLAGAELVPDVWDMADDVEGVMAELLAAADEIDPPRRGGRQRRRARRQDGEEGLRPQGRAEEGNEPEGDVRRREGVGPEARRRGLTAPMAHWLRAAAASPPRPGCWQPPAAGTPAGALSDGGACSPWPLPPVPATTEAAMRSAWACCS